MKKAIFTLAFALVVVTVGAKYYSYDINKDGMINITDVTFLVNNILGIPNSGEDEQNFVYDVNGDDYVNITDVTIRTRSQHPTSLVPTTTTRT